MKSLVGEASVHALGHPIGPYTVYLVNKHYARCILFGYIYKDTSIKVNSYACMYCVYTVKLGYSEFIVTIGFTLLYLLFII